MTNVTDPILKRSPTTLLCAHVFQARCCYTDDETDNHSGDSKTMLIRANWQALLEYTVDCDELR